MPSQLDFCCKEFLFACETREKARKEEINSKFWF